MHRRPIARRAPQLDLLALAVALAVAPPLLAQGTTGSVRGRVLTAELDRPLAGVQVYVVGTGRGAVTNDRGEYVITQVPPGAQVLRAEMLGYQQADQQITVAAGEATTAEFRLRQQALALDEVVVTGTAGAARRREIGNTIAQINVAQVATPTPTVNALLQARAPGMVVTRTDGGVGGGARIRLRGNHSASMDNQPLIYVDGVRIMSNGFPKNTFPVGYAGNSDNTIYSPLNDINPADIERIEVIKGPAATTLYGTEAAAGVIQIFTKRGGVGRAHWTAQVSEGVSHVQKFGISETLVGKPLRIPPGEENPYGTPAYMYMEPWLKNGLSQKYDLSVSGGGQELRYFVAGSWTHEKGVLPDDSLNQYGLRGNLSFSPMKNLELTWNTGYSRNTVRKTPNGGTAAGLSLNAARRDRNYFQSKDPAVIGRVLAFNIHDYIDHLTTGVTATYAPLPGWTNRLTVGTDLAQQESREFQPYGFPNNPPGQISDEIFTNRTTTVDYVGTYQRQLTPWLNNSFSWGGQAVSTLTTSTTAASLNFPGPGDPTVSSGSIKLGFEDRLSVINAGFFFQNIFNVKDRYYLTLGVRVDGNSAFGESLGLQAYPKASFSYVLSDEPFWNPSWGTVKLRAAYGQSGRAPGAFDAVRTWTATPWGTATSFLPNNPGNPDLGPERSSEVEGGFDASFLNDRLTAVFTYYYDRTSDALFAVRSSPSNGGWNSQLRNVGKLENRGLELSLNATIVQQERFGWEVGATLSTNHSKVLDLGGAAPFSLGNYGYIVEGQPVPVMRGFCIKNKYEIAEPIIEPDCNVGPNNPTHTIVGTMRFRLPGNLELSARGEYQGGAYAYGLQSGEGLTRGIDWPSCWDAYPAIESGDLSSLPAIERVMCRSATMRRDFAIWPLDFFRFRDATLVMPLPFRLPKAQSATLTLSAQNLYTWKEAKYTYLDPETSGGFSSTNNTGQNARVHQVEGSIPIPATFTASLRVVF